MSDTATYTPRLKADYKARIRAELKEEFGYQNIHQVPMVTKVVVNMGLGDATQNSKLVDVAMGEWIEANGGNAFADISLPETSMRLMQACGRLLRKETDTGRVTLLDKRIVSKYYGKQLIRALPPFKLVLPNTQ